MRDPTTGVRPGSLPKPPPAKTRKPAAKAKPSVTPTYSPPQLPTTFGRPFLPPPPKRGGVRQPAPKPAASIVRGRQPLVPPTPSMVGRAPLQQVSDALMHPHREENALKALKQPPGVLLKRYGFAAAQQIPKFVRDYENRAGWEASVAANPARWEQGEKPSLGQKIVRADIAPGVDLNTFGNFGKDVYTLGRYGGPAAGRSLLTPVEEFYGRTMEGLTAMPGGTPPKRYTGPTVEQLVKDQVNYYDQTYWQSVKKGDWGALREQFHEHPFFTAMDLATFVLPAARATTIARAFAGGKSLGEAVTHSFHPPTDRTLRMASGPRAVGVEVPFPQSRHPLGRSWQKTYDAFSKWADGKRVVGRAGETVRASRQQGKLAKAEERRAYAKAVPLARRIKGVVFPSISTQNKAARLRLYWEAQFPKHLHGDQLIQDIVDELTRAKTSPLPRPPGEEPAGLASHRKYTEGLQEQHNQLTNERNASIEQAKLEPLKQELASLRGKLQAARDRGLDTTAIEAQMKSATNRIAAATNRDVPALDHPIRSEIVQAMERSPKIGPEKAQVIAKALDRWAYHASPDDPAGYYAKRFTGATFHDGEPPSEALLANPDVYRQEEGWHDNLVGERLPPAPPRPAHLAPNETGHWTDREEYYARRLTDADLTRNRMTEHEVERNRAAERERHRGLRRPGEAERRRRRLPGHSRRRAARGEPDQRLRQPRASGAAADDLRRRDSPGVHAAAGALGRGVPSG
jgi:hypothetical protein